MPHISYKLLFLGVYVSSCLLFSFPIYSLHGGKFFHARGRSLNWNIRYHREDWKTRKRYYQGWQRRQYGWPTYYTYYDYPISGPIYYDSYPTNPNFYYPSPSYQTNWTYPSYPYSGKYYVNDYPYNQRQVFKSYQSPLNYGRAKHPSQLQSNKSNSSVFFTE